MKYFDDYTSEEINTMIKDILGRNGLEFQELNATKEEHFNIFLDLEYWENRVGPEMVAEVWQEFLDEYKLNRVQVNTASGRYVSIVQFGNDLPYLLGTLQHRTELIIDQKLVDDLQRLVNQKEA